MRQINYLISYLNLSHSLKQWLTIIKNLRGSHPYQSTPTYYAQKWATDTLTELPKML